MAVSFPGGVNYLYQPEAIVNAPPFSFAAWVYLNSTSIDAYVFGVGCTSAKDLYYLEFPNTLDKFSATANSTSGTLDQTAASNNGSGIVTGQWYHVAAVYTNTSSRTIYINGGHSVNSIVNIVTTPADFTQTSLGAEFYNGAFYNELDGYIAYPTIWNVALSSGDVTSLWNGGSGADPRTIESGSVVSFSLLSEVSSPWYDSYTHENWTTVGSLTHVSDPFAIGAPPQIPYSFWGAGYA